MQIFPSHVQFRTPKLLLLLFLEFGNKLFMKSVPVGHLILSLKTLVVTDRAAFAARAVMQAWAKVGLQL